MDNSFHQYRDAVTTAKGSPVPTDIFMNKDYAGISAVLYSYMNVVNRPNKIGVEVNIVHNPLADNKMPLKSVESQNVEFKPNWQDEAGDV
ncbi:MAG: hypothetical protein HY035_04680 [Nitrospirae bacterium]|nr:hypothetical protein [Nitrospirota bacterium]MBI3377684.1 hypothetical protein [Nitrospirota bacterium]